MIRRASPVDTAPMLAIYAPFIEETAVSFEVDVPTVTAFATRVRNCQQRYPWIVCELGGEIAGYAYGGVHRSRQAYQWATEVSVYVNPDFQKRGIASGLYTALFELLRAQGYRQALAGITLPNPGSEGFHAALGFEHFATYEDVGFKFGKWASTSWSRYWLDEKGTAPSELVMPEELDKDVWKRAFALGMKKVR